MASMSKLEMKLEFIGTDVIVKGEISRYVAPLTIQALMDKAPFTARMRHNIGSPKSYIMIFTDIKKGTEKNPVSEVKKGDIVYSPKQDALFIIYSEPIASLIKPLTYIGKITEGLEKLSGLRNGLSVTVSFKSLS